MNTFKFIGTIQKPTDKSQLVKISSNGIKQLKLLIRQNENNYAHAQMYGDKLYNGGIPVYFSSSNSRKLVKYEDRLNDEILSQINYTSKYFVRDGNKTLEFIWKDDFMEYVSEMIETLPSNTLYEIRGEYVISNYNGKKYNNFNIKSIRVANGENPQFTLDLSLFYNFESLDESDKKNKFLLNAYIEQYYYPNKRKEYFPLQVQFITNRFDFKKPTDVEIIRHRKANMSPAKEDGFVSARWEAQYIRGTEFVEPPLETLPKDIQFEIINAGRDIKEYMGKIVGDVKECICLTRPNNTQTPNGKVYTSLNCTDNEFRSKINKTEIESESVTFDSVAENDAKQNPFN